MVMRSTQDSAGNIYKRMESINITCPVCEQDIDTVHRYNFIIDPSTKRLIHTGCVERLYAQIKTEESITLDD